MTPQDPRKAETYERALDAFRRGIEGTKQAVEFVEIPYEGTSLPALFLPVPGATEPTPCMVHFDGFDVTKEIIYLQHGYDLPKKGVALLIVDHPGVGAALRQRNLPTRYDIEVPAGAAVDYLETRPEIDPKRIGIMALSLGGYYAPRAAAFEKRFACCVAWGAIWDWHASRVRREQAGGVGMSVPPFQDLWVFGAKDWDDFVEKRKRFTLEGVADKITCPLLVTHGAEDRQIPVEYAQKTVDAAVNSPRRELKVFTAEEGGTQHCQADNVTIGTDYMHDWIADVLGAKPPR
jgi:dienelactone hydrolase